MATSSQAAGVISCDGLETTGWYAWNDLMPPLPDFVRVIGEVEVPNPGVTVELVYRSPQGINPAILFLDLVLYQRPGIWPQPVVRKPVRYEAPLQGGTYSQCWIFCDDRPIVVIEVDTVHVAVDFESGRRRARQSQTAGEAVDRMVRGGSIQPFSGENPFPWFRSGATHPICLSGGLSAVQVGFCMDKVPYALSVHGVHVRVAGASKAVSERLEEYAYKDVVITVCGSFHASVETGCAYLLAERVEPAANFAALLTDKG